jgi:apolipoprotein N-acyltransferase
MRLLIALALGLLSAFAFEPVGWWPLMIVACAGLAWLVERQERLRAALAVGWGFGVGQFVLGLNWIATAFTFQSNVLLSLYLAVYPMLAAGLAWRFGKDRPAALVFALSGGWAITEWLRATMFTGFAWNPVGVTLVDTPWRGASAFIGTYGLSALAVLAGGFVWMLARRMWQAPAAFAVGAVLLALLPRPDLQAPSATAGNGLIRVVQPNIGQADKWREGFERIAAERLLGLSRAPFNKPAAPDMLYWPEAAVTEPLVDERTAAAPLVAFERIRAVRSIGPDQLLATGGLALTSSDGERVDGATNSVFVLDPSGTIVGRYDKAHLVPYGEYLPMRPVLSAIGLSRLAPGDLDFRPGPGARTLPLPNGLRMGVQICYEIIFSGEVVDRRNRPDYIFNPSNDAWFGSWGPPQHLAQARLRAAEEALPVIRATPTGISAVIDSRGALAGTVGGGKQGVIDSGLPAAGAPTLFSRLGNVIPLVLGFGLLIAAIVLGRSRRYSTVI